MANDSVVVHVGSKVVGHVSGGVFRKRMKASRHMLRKPRAWALDIQSLVDAEALGAHTVAIEDIETAQTYSAPMSLIRRFGFVFDRGHGRQIGLPLEQWAVTGGEVPLQLSLLEVTP